MTNEPQSIFFDESGFTGNNLLHREQTIFSYASVAADSKHAENFVRYLIKTYNIQNSELKGKNLIKYSKGRKAILELITEFDGCIKVTIYNKKYALACKFFEYIFEPCISDNQALFYSIDFHRFIATFLYAEFMARCAGAEDIFADFENLMRKQCFDGLNSLFSTSTHPEMSPVLSQIREFAITKQHQIAEELASLPGNGAGKWILELTSTSLFTLLADWGQKFDSIRAYCDNSQPLQHDQSFFDAMIDREDLKYIESFDRKQPLTFNLAEGLNFVDSNVVHGIQLADAAAAAFAYAMGDASDDFAMKLRERAPNIVADGAVIPEAKYMDLERPEVQRNAVVLHELHSRVIKGDCLLTGMPEFVQFVTHRLRHDPI